MNNDNRHQTLKMKRVELQALLDVEAAVAMRQDRPTVPEMPAAKRAAADRRTL